VQLAADVEQLLARLLQEGCIAGGSRGVDSTQLCLQHCSRRTFCCLDVAGSRLCSSSGSSRLECGGAVLIVVGTVLVLLPFAASAVYMLYQMRAVIHRAAVLLTTG